MNNLGWYQKITTIAKKVGGPKNLTGITLVTGYVVFRSAEGVIKRIYKSTKEKDENNGIIESVFEVTENGIDKSGLSLEVGDYFKVLEIDCNIVLIEKINDENSPYYVESDFLTEISSSYLESANH